MKKFEKLSYREIKTKKVSDYESSFSVQPLERGFGNTLGNAVRRVLLSSISGVAPFAVKIAGVKHEFQTIPGVLEDAIQLILNINAVCFVYNKDVFGDGEIVRVSLKNKTSGEITAGDLKLPPGVEVVDPNHYIASVEKNQKLELEIFLISGRGYVPFSKNKELIKRLRTKMETKIKNGEFIAVDSDFSPVKKVSYSAVELNTSSPTIQEKLTINVLTDGSVSAKEVIAQAADILIAHLKLISDISNLEKEEVFEKKARKYEKMASAPLPITSLDLSVRSYNCLKRAGFKTLEDIAKITLTQLKNIKNLGQKSVEEVLEKLKEHNVKLKEEE